MHDGSPGSQNLAISESHMVRKKTVTENHRLNKNKLSNNKLGGNVKVKQ